MKANWLEFFFWRSYRFIFFLKKESVFILSLGGGTLGSKIALVASSIPEKLKLTMTRRFRLISVRMSASLFTSQGVR